jgi:L-alanine-DL-glutamate epimerase-like enolase superfamily enzyme
MALAASPAHTGASNTVLLAALECAVERVDVAAYTVPTDEPESDGTYEWDSTTIVVVEVHAGGETGLGYTYADASAAELVRSKLAPLVRASNTVLLAQVRDRAGAALRNAGRPGAGWMALSAVDVALWDLKARLLGLPLVDLLPAAHEEVPIYGSGGFCSYSLERLRSQLGGWVREGIPRVKMKISREPEADPRRLDAVRDEIGFDVELYCDSNGALSRKEALAWAERLAGEWGVSWFEEPVSSADLEGLRLLRDRGPGGLDIAAGEYAYVLADFHNLVEAGAVDCLQADVTRCGGITGLLQAAPLAAAFGLDVSGHCAPQISAHALAAVPNLRHLEYFHDHDRVERLLFDGCLDPAGGALRPDRSRPGHGLELKRTDAERYAA